MLLDSFRFMFSFREKYGLINLHFHKNIIGTFNLEEIIFMISNEQNEQLKKIPRNTTSFHSKFLNKRVSS